MNRNLNLLYFSATDTTAKIIKSVASGFSENTKEYNLTMSIYVFLSYLIRIYPVYYLKDYSGKFDILSTDKNVNPKEFIRLLKQFCFWMSVDVQKWNI